MIADHAEDASLTDGAQLHEGEVSAMLGLAGWPAAAEEMVVARDLLLAELTGGRLHLCHVSTGARSSWSGRPRPARSGSPPRPPPPLPASPTRPPAPMTRCSRSARPCVKADVEAVRLGLADGTLDAIATDHAPHAREDKEVEWASAPPGMLGLETALAVTLTELVEPGYLDLAPRSSGSPPAGALPAGAGARRTGGAGAPANLAVLDPAATWTVDRARLASRARNTPFHGRQLRGRVVHTLLRGPHRPRRAGPAVTAGGARG